MNRLTIVIAVFLAAATACNKRDPDVDKLQKEVDDLTEQLGKLKEQIAQQVKPHQAQPPEAPVPEPPILPTEAEIDPSVPGECVGYLAAVEAYQHCDKAAPAAREAMEKAVTQMRASWHANMPEAARTAASDACATAADALRSGAHAIGCTILVEKGP